MTSTAMGTSLPGDQATVSVFVAVDPDVAFDVFTKETDLWWQRGLRFRPSGRAIGALCLEPGVGGRLFETFERPVGTPITAEFGRVTVWDPPARFVLAWRNINFGPDDRSTELEVLFEGDVPGYRQVFLDGREHPRDPNPTWQGHAVGRWDHGALVIDTIGFNDRSWLSYAGHPHTEAMRLTETLRRPDAGHLEIEVVVHDPGAFSKPWKTVRVYELTPADEIQEYICSENNKYGRLVSE